MRTFLMSRGRRVTIALSLVQSSQGFQHSDVAYMAKRTTFGKGEMLSLDPYMTRHAAVGFLPIYLLFFFCFFWWSAYSKIPYTAKERKGNVMDGWKKGKGKHGRLCS